MGHGVRMARSGIPQVTEKIARKLRCTNADVLVWSHRHPVMPSLEGEENVDVQIGPRLFQNVPQKMRSNLWDSMVQKSELGRGCVMKYPALQAQIAHPKVCSDIEKDVPRTFPDVREFSSPDGQRRLMRLLRSYSILDPAVGYCQGMNFIAGVFLKYVENESVAFGAFCMLMQERNYRELFLPDMHKLKERMDQLEKLLPRNVASVLEECDIPPTYYAPQWFLSCFSNEMPTAFAAR